MEPTPPRPPPAPPARAAVGLLVALVFAFPLIGMTVQLLNLPLGLWWTEAFLFFAPAYLLARAWNGRPLEALGLARPGVRPLVIGLLAGLCNYPLTAALEAAVRAWFMARWPDFTRSSDISALLGHVVGWQRVAFVAAVGLAAPLGEETFFRGLFQGALRPRLRDAGAVLVTALCFGAIHFEPIGLIARVELGALFGILVIWTGSLWSSVAAHAANNLLATAIYYATARAPEEAPATPLELLQLAGIGVVLTTPVLIAAWSYRRHEVRPPWEPPAPMARAVGNWALAALAGLLLVLLVRLASR